MIDTFLRALGFGLCHQLPARSFFVGSHQLPVCARDTGIYLGFVLSLLVIALLDRGRRRTELPHPTLLAIGGAFIAFLAWDGITSYAGLRASNNDLRLITGLLTGWALPLAVVPMVNASLWRRSEPSRVLGEPAEAVAWLAAVPVAFALAKWVFPLTGLAYALLVAACIVVTFVTVNSIIILLAPRMERRADRLRDAWLVWSLALVLTAAEIGAAALLRLALQSAVPLG